jgi:hypothetical protein
MFSLFSLSFGFLPFFFLNFCFFFLLNSCFISLSNHPTSRESEGKGSFSRWMILSPLNFIKMVGFMIHFRLRWAETSCIWVEKAKTLFSYIDYWGPPTLVCDVSFVYCPNSRWTFNWCQRWDVPQVNASVAQMLQNKSKKKNRKGNNWNQPEFICGKNWICSWINIHNPT